MTGRVRHRDPAASCQGKIAYTSWAIAMQAARRNFRLRRQPYHCGFCQLVHLGPALNRSTAPLKIRRPRLTHDDLE